MSIDSINNSVITIPEANAGISQAGKVRSEGEAARAKFAPKKQPEIVYPVDKKPMSQEKAVDTIEKANKAFIAFDRRFEFSIHEKTRQIMVKVIDVNNDEIIRELPPEKVLDMVAAMWEIAGILVDEKI